MIKLIKPRDTSANSKLKTREQCVKSVQKYKWRHENDVNDVV